MRLLLKPIEGNKAALKAYHGDLRAIIAEVQAMEQDRPGLVPVLKDVQGIVTELENLAK